MLQATFSSRIAAGLLCVFLAACGGGGGDSGSSATPQAETNGALGANTGSGSSQPQTSTPTASTPTSAQGSSPPPSSSASEPGTTPSPSALQPDATQARFNQPLGIAIDTNGNLYVADAGNHTIRKIAVSGVVSTLAGSPGTSGSTDGVGATARFSFLKGITVDSAGNVYAVDNSTVRKITPAGDVTTLAGASGLLGDADGPGVSARFRRPWGIAADAAGNLYVADTENALIRKVAPTGAVTTFAGTRGMRGTANGSTASATFLGPMGVAIDAGGTLYITDWYGPPAPNIPEGSTFIRKISANGTVSTMAGSFNGETGPAAFMDSFALAADAGGNVYIAALNSVRKVSPSGTISTLAGPSAQFQSLDGITIDAAGNLLVTDVSAHTVSRVSQSGGITLVAGKPGEAGSANVP